METAEIISKIQQALEKCSLDSGIDKRDVRVKIIISEGFVADGVKCSLMNKSTLVHDIEIRNLLGLDPLKSKLVSNYLSSTLKKIAKNDGIPAKDINARIYNRNENFYPSVYLYNAGKAIREITIEELTGN